MHRAVHGPDIEFAVCCIAVPFVSFGVALKDAVRAIRNVDGTIAVVSRVHQCCRIARSMLSHHTYASRIARSMIAVCWLVNHCAVCVFRPVQGDNESKCITRMGGPPLSPCVGGAAGQR